MDIQKIYLSLTLLNTLATSFIWAGWALFVGFAFAMLIGVITGTYSSIFVAAPILVDMDKGDGLKNEVDKEARIEELLETKQRLISDPQSGDRDRALEEIDLALRELGEGSAYSD